MTKYIKMIYPNIFSEYKKEEICNTYNIYSNISEAELKYIIYEYIFSNSKRLDKKIIPYVNELKDDFLTTQYDKYKLFRAKNAYVSNSLEFFKAKFGNEKSNDKWITSNNDNKQSKTLKNFIVIYGKEQGTLKWNTFCEKNKNNFSLERMTSKYGKAQGLEKYNELYIKLKNKNTLEYYKNRFGDKIGSEKYKLRNSKNSKSSKLNSIWKRATPAYNKYREKMEISGDWVKLSDLEDIQLYRRLVSYNTNSQKLHLLKDFDKRNHQNVEDSYALDHKISIKYGFNNNIPPYIIGNLDNLQMLPHYENSSKKDKCYSSLKQRIKNV